MCIIVLSEKNLKIHPMHNVHYDSVSNIGWRIDTHNVDALG